MSAMAKRCPCNGCVAPRRHPGCHDHCHSEGDKIGYIEWKAELDAIHEKEKAEKQIEAALTSFKLEGIDKAKRKDASINRRCRRR